MMIGSNYLHAFIMLINKSNYNRLYNILNKNGSIIIEFKYLLIFVMLIILFMKLFTKFCRLIYMMNKMLLYLQIIVKLFRYLDLIKLIYLYLNLLKELI